MLEKKPSLRYQSVRDVGFSLESLSGSGETSSITAAKEKKKRTEKVHPSTFTRVTFRRGNIMSARFAPDGSILYGAMWEDRPLEISESRPLGLLEADIFSISPTGELALALGRSYTYGWETTATLARMPLMGGRRARSPRTCRAPSGDRMERVSWFTAGITADFGSSIRSIASSSKAAIG